MSATKNSSVSNDVVRPVQSAPTSSHVARKETPSPRDALMHKLEPPAQNLAGRLRFSRMSDVECSNDYLLQECYKQSITELNQELSAVRRFTEALARVAIEDDRRFPAFEIDTLIRQNTKQVIRTWPPLIQPLPIKAVTVATIPDAGHCLGRIVNCVMQRLAESIIQFADRGLVGTVTWHGLHVADFTYGRFQMTDETLDHQVDEQTSTRQYDRARVVRKVHTTVRTDKRAVASHMFLVTHKRRLTDPRLLTLEAAEEMPKPKRIDEFLHTIPAWLLPEIRLLAGDIFQEVREREHLKTQQHVVQSVKEDVRTEDIPRPHPDPAIVLAGFAIAGWHPDEVSI